MSKNLLSKESVLWAIEHLSIYGDTDIFPRPIELKFFSQMSEKIAVEISSSLDLNAYKSSGILESLVPKSKLGFRIGHQPHPLDTLLLTAALSEIGSYLEEARRPAGEFIAFSYRFKADINGSMFAPGHKYSDWLHHQWTKLVFSEYTHVVKTDISDFFQRIYHHRIDNCLSHYTHHHRLGKFVFKILKEFTVRQSFGLPVGSDFARIIAEAVLVDTDEALLREGYDFTRYVDDMVIFIKPGQDPYGALSFLAEHLAKCEGLSLSSQKTRIYDAQVYQANLQVVEDAENDDDAAEALIRSEFLDISGGDDQLDLEKIEKVSKLDLPALLEEAVESDVWDPSKIKILLRALKIVKSTACVDYIKDKFVTLLPFSKDVVLLMEELHNSNPGIFSDMREKLLSVLVEPTCQALPVVRAWIFEIFIRGICPFYSSDFRKLPWSTETLDRRQIILLSHAANDVAFFRSRKTRLSELNSWETASFVYGATCLPRDEYEVWVQGTRKSETFHLSDLFYDWCLGINKLRVFDPTSKAPHMAAPALEYETAL